MKKLIKIKNKIKIKMKLSFNVEQFVVKSALSDRQ